MAVDGVAPRAKMNQQRGRRFRSAKEATDLIEKAKQKGETLPTESRFDSNCITPGTAFMARLQDALKHFVKTKLSTDASWQKCRFILSGHEVSTSHPLASSARNTYNFTTYGTSQCRHPAKVSTKLWSTFGT